MKHVELIDVKKMYGWGKLRKVVFDGLNLHVRYGECIAIYGERHSGKTILFELLAGIEAIDYGQVIIGQDDLAFKTEEERARIRREEIGIYSVKSPLINDKTIAENINIMKTILKKKQPLELVDELIDYFKIYSVMKKYPTELDQEERELALYIRALSNNPSLILMDEPQSDTALQKLIRYARGGGHTLIYTTSSWDQVELAQGVVRLEDSKVVEHSE